MIQENLYTTNKIRTFTGKYIDVFNPDPDCINIVDIAHALSLQCRWGGHCQKFYSIAQHSFSCYTLAKPEFKLAALLHDAAEAYLCDIPRPIKLRLPDYQMVEDNLMKAIALKFNFQYPIQPEVKAIDIQMLEYEWAEIVLKYGEIEAWDSRHAEASFLAAASFQIFLLTKRTN